MLFLGYWAWTCSWRKANPTQGDALTLAIAVLARAFTPLQLRPHCLLKCREFWRGFIEYFEGTGLRIPDVARSPVEFVKGHNYQPSMTNKLKKPRTPNCIKWHILTNTRGWNEWSGWTGRILMTCATHNLWIRNYSKNLGKSGLNVVTRWIVLLLKWSTSSRQRATPLSFD